MNHWKKVAIAAFLAILFALFFFLNSFNLTFDSALLPRILMGLIVLLSLGALFEAWYKEKHHVHQAHRIDEPDDEELDEIQDEGKINYRRAFIFTLLVALYIFLLDKVGYFIITPIYIIGAYRYLKSMSLLKSVVIAVGFTVFVYAVFVAFLKIPIPMGFLE